MPSNDDNNHDDDAIPPSVPIHRTKHLRIDAYGLGPDGEQFARIVIESRDGERTALFRLDSNLPDYTDLIAKGARLFTPAARTEFLERIQEWVPPEPSFRVGTQIGCNGEAFVFPDGVIGAPPGEIEVQLTDRLRSHGSKFTVNGTLDGWSELAALAARNTRMTLGLCFGFAGPVVGFIGGERVAIQSVGRTQSGKSTIAFAIGSIWGGRAEDTVRGFCESWKTTTANVDVMAAGHCDTPLILDETGAAQSTGGKAANSVVESTMALSEGRDKGRFTDKAPPRRWRANVYSTSNRMLDVICLEAGVVVGDEHRSRLVDVGPPVGGFGMFEDLHGRLSVAELSAEIRRIGAANFGVAGREFVTRLVDWLHRDEEGLRRWAKERREYYLKKASKITEPGRQLERIHQSFGTIYVAGCLAIEFDLLPLKKQDVRHALLTCVQDHVDLVRGFKREMAQERLIELLRKHIRANRNVFIDVRGRPAKPKGHDHATCQGYIGEHNDEKEYWIPSETFDKVVGGVASAKALKRELADRRLIRKVSSDGEARFAVKVYLWKDDTRDDRPSVIAVRASLLR